MQPDYSFSEQRHEPRIPLRLPIDLGFARGYTRDISASGCYINLDSTEAIPLGLISFTLNLASGTRPMQRHCTGQVVRVVQADSGVAIEILESVIEVK